VIDSGLPGALPLMMNSDDQVVHIAALSLFF